MGAKVMTKRMGGMGKISDFSKTNQPEHKAEAEPKPSEEIPTIQPPPEPPTTPAIAAAAPPPKSKPKPKKEKLVTLNIKIAQIQQEWLADTARDIRGNNSDPVPPADRVFPQHLIGVAIDLLESSDIDWSQIKNAQDLRAALRL